MRKTVALLLALMMVLCAGLSLGEENKLPFTEEQLALSPDIPCSAHPTVYSSPRYLNTESQKAFDLPYGLSAKQINNATNREFGLYFKFTPGGKDAGYRITRFDVVVTAQNGEKLYIDGFDSDMECKAGYYWAWDFFPLEGLFINMRTLYGQVVAGKYRMDIYFNREWAGNTMFTIAN